MGLSLFSLGYFAIYGQEFSQSVIFIMFESDPAEASEYFGQYFAWWMVPTLLIYSGTALAAVASRASGFTCRGAAPGLPSC